MTTTRTRPGTRTAALLITLALGSTTTLLTVMPTQRASADPSSYVAHVANTNDEGLWLHPDAATLNGTLSVLMPEGMEFDVSCVTGSDDVNGDTAWAWGTDANGDQGYASDAYLDTPTTTGNEIAQLAALGVPECSTNPGEQVTTTTASPAAPSMDLSNACQGSYWVQDLVVLPLPGDNFKIEITPNPEIREPWNAKNRDITVDIWHDIQSCIPGLYGDLADSIWQQLQCHQELALVPNAHGGLATGPTFDFESWHPSLPNPGIGTYVSSHCLNELGTDPGPVTGPAVRPGQGLPNY